MLWIIFIISIYHSREFQFKVKGVSMSKFTEEDWAGLAGVGNEVFNSAYLARLNPRDHPTPNGSTEINKLKDFIRQKYIDKKWHADGAHGGSSFAAAPASSSGAATAEDASRINIKLGSRPVLLISICI